MAAAGLAPRIMGYRPGPAVQKLLAQTGLTLEQMDVIEAQRGLRGPGPGRAARPGPGDDDARVNAWGGAIALGHPLGASGAAWRPRRSTACTLGGRYALCTMCIGVGQGIAVILEKV